MIFDKPSNEPFKSAEYLQATFRLPSDYRQASIADPEIKTMGNRGQGARRGSPFLWAPDDRSISCMGALISCKTCSLPRMYS